MELAGLYGMNGFGAGFSNLDASWICLATWIDQDRYWQCMQKLENRSAHSLWSLHWFVIVGAKLSAAWLTKVAAFWYDAESISDADLSFGFWDEFRHRSFSIEQLDCAGWNLSLRWQDLNEGCGQKQSREELDRNSAWSWAPFKVDPHQILSTSLRRSWEKECVHLKLNHFPTIAKWITSGASDLCTLTNPCSIFHRKVSLTTDHFDI